MAFFQAWLRCPKGEKQPLGRQGRPRGADGLSAHRRPGYPLAGCSPAEPASVSPGGKAVPQRAPANKISRPTTARGSVRKTGQGVAKDRSFLVRNMGSTSLPM
jgi:hypothetical protein